MYKAMSVSHIKQCLALIQNMTKNLLQSDVDLHVNNHLRHLKLFLYVT